MINTKACLGSCLMILLLGTLILFQGPARANSVETRFENYASLKSEEPDDDLSLQYALPTSRVGITHSLVRGERNLEPRNWHAAETSQFPYVLFQPVGIESMQPNRAAGTCTVSNTGDSGPNTLRQCLTDAVAGDQITFDPTTFPTGSPATISLATSQLPYVTVNNLTIDASNAGVILDGSALTGTPIGLRLDTVTGVTIRGLQIVNFYLGILLNNAAYNTIGGDRAIGAGPMGQGNLISGNSYAGMQLQLSGTTNNAILGNFIGTDLTGTTANGNTDGGIVILSGPSQNVIGGSHSAGVCDGSCNLISGSDVGVVIYSGGSEGNEVLGNFIGPDISGDNSIGGQMQGVLVGDEAAQNVIGGTHTAGACDGPCNLISGNLENGVVLKDSGTTGNQVLGNFIGTDSSGNSANGNNLFAGVMIAFEASQNVVGGSHSAGVCDGPCNLISGNPVGVQMQNAGSNSNEILGNFIGTDLAGNNAIGNGHGIRFSSGASQNVIGGARSGAACDGPCNLISGNIAYGVVVYGTGTNGNQLLGNFVGTNATGDAALPNDEGLDISQGATDTQIGGAGTGEGNLISGNTDCGVCFWNADTTGSQVMGNFIGTNAAGDDSISNNHGVTIGEGASDTQVGGIGTGEGNLISGNTNMGLWMDSPTTTGNQVLGNLIGTDISGTSDVPNYHGVLISTGSTGNQIGNATPGGGNLISGNEYTGIWMEYVEAPGNTIAGNKIGTNLAGTGAVPNYIGIKTTLASSNLIGGTDPGGGNLISGNWDTGLYIDGGNFNLVQGNTIGTDLTGEVAVPNIVRGIVIGFGASSNTIGGTVPGSGNLISGNGDSGIHLQNETSVDNQILGNYIGTNRTGSSALPNNVGVVLIQAYETIIGGADTSTPWVCDGPCNLISGNSIFGISIQGISPGEAGKISQGEMDPILLADQGNRVMGNFIGTDLTGTLALPNPYGVNLTFEAAGNIIGGSNLLGEGNLISGNQHDGILIQNPLTTNNQVTGNRIGTTADGEAALPNGRHGISIINGASSNTVGGDSLGQGNLISGHALDPLYLAVSISTEVEPDSTNNQVIGNLIGTNSTGTSAIPNSGGVGVAYLVTGTTIRDNLISGNSQRGILLLETTGNEVRDNQIGVAADGVTPLPNDGVGIILVTAPQNTIGTGNTVAYNQFGIAIGYPESVGNTITQNSIFANTAEQIEFFEVPQPLAPAPVLTGWDGAVLSGTACEACQVEIFANEDPEPAGHTYLDTVAASGDGTFNLTIGSGYRYLAATATDADGTTSEFSNSLFAGTYTYVYLPLVANAVGQP